MTHFSFIHLTLHPFSPFFPPWKHKLLRFNVNPHFKATSPTLQPHSETGGIPFIARFSILFQSPVFTRVAYSPEIQGDLLPYQRTPCPPPLPCVLCFSGISVPFFAQKNVLLLPPLRGVCVFVCVWQTQRERERDTHPNPATGQHHKNPLG